MTTMLCVLGICFPASDLEVRTVQTVTIVAPCVEDQPPLVACEPQEAQAQHGKPDNG